MFIYISYIYVQLYIIQIFVYTFLSISFTNRYKWIHKYMQIEKYIFCTNVCGSICREATLVNLSHSSICNLIVCVHSPQRYCCFFLYRHTHRQACTHIHRHRYRHRQTQTHTQIHSSIFNLIVCVHSPQRYCCYFQYRHRHTHRKLIHRHTKTNTQTHSKTHTQTRRHTQIYKHKYTNHTLKSSLN